LQANFAEPLSEVRLQAGSYGVIRLDSSDACMNNEKPSFFDKPENVRLLLRIFYGICILLFALDFVIHRHTEFRAEGLPGFYPIYGFVGCVILVFAAKWMRTFLMRPEDYYDRRELTDNTKSSDSPEQAPAAPPAGGHADV